MDHSNFGVESGWSRDERSSSCDAYSSSLSRGLVRVAGLHCYFDEVERAELAFDSAAADNVTAVTKGTTAADNGTAVTKGTAAADNGKAVDKGTTAADNGTAVANGTTAADNGTAVTKGTTAADNGAAVTK